MKYDEAINYIKKIGNFGSNYGLERTERILEIIGNPHKSLKVIHVAGTNGKGSTTSTITSLMMAEGFKVGMYTSPFLEEFEERIQINRVNISREDLSKYLEKIKVAVDKVIEEGYNHPTEFEIITCLMFKYFSENNVDYAVVEVGLGGRLDSTNVVSPKISVLASISLDHTNLLGNTIEEIAREKCGIIKEGVPVISFPQNDRAKKVIEEIANEKKSEVTFIKNSDTEFLGVEEEGKIYQKILYKNRYEVLYGLLGEHQILNGLLALETVLKLSEIEDFNLNHIEEGFKNVSWNGRLEVMFKEPLIVIDGAHNIEGIEMLSKNIKKYFKYKKLHLLIGILADKDVKHMLQEIVPLSDDVIALTPNSYRAELAEDLKNEILPMNKNVKSFESYEEGFKQALLNAEDGDLILATGSLYMIGELRGIINKII